MKAKYLIGALGILAVAVVAHAETDRASLQAAWGKHASSFTDPVVGGAGHLRVTATEKFLKANPTRKKEALEKLAAAWRQASPKDPLLLEVRWRYGGWLWRGERGRTVGRERVSLVDRWDDASFPWIQESSPWGKWFLFVGGQGLSGGDTSPSSGFNVRIGTTLYRDKYDVAFTFNQTFTGSTPNTELTAVGIIGRALFRVPKTNWGYNIGGGATVLGGRNFDIENQFNLLGGLNYYQLKGTWDLSLNLGDEGVRTLILGYSVFLSR
jgi:hypothetical protein